MRRRGLSLITALTLAGLVGACASDGRTMRLPGADQVATISSPSTTEPPLISPEPSEVTLPPEPIEPLTLVAPWEFGEPIDARFTCAGENVSPALSWSGTTTEAIELAVTMTDLDAEDYVHWALTGLDPDVTSLDEGVVPDGAVQATNSAGTIGYTGPCPPVDTTHTYLVEVHLLNQQLEVADGESPTDMLFAIRAATFDSVSTTGTFTMPAAPDTATPGTDTPGTDGDERAATS